MNVLALIHGSEVRSSLFGDVVEQRGHRLEEWSLAWGAPPPRPLDDYGAVLVFGGAMHADQDDHHPWLREENLLIQRLLDGHTPLLGVCLGAQLIAKASHAPVHAAPQPEIGWHTVELTEEARDDPVFQRLPERFEAFEWHFYTHGLPAGAVELARTPVCTQAFRLGDCVWVIQFHAEVTQGQIRRWIGAKEEVPVDLDELDRETADKIDAWNAIGRDLCNAFVDAAERVVATV